MEPKAKNYIETIGRRKSATARVRITPSAKTQITVNGDSSDDYFKTGELRAITKESIEKSGIPQKFIVTAKVLGGGTHAQAEAIRLGIARGIVKHDPETKTALKKAGFLKRDSRKVERKKFGLKKARKAPKWSKR